MTKRADTLALLFHAGDIRYIPEGYGRTLASHLLGETLDRGDRVALPGWPSATVEAVSPEGGQVQPGTEVTIHVPPRPSEGALTTVFLVDASLTMGQGDPSLFDQAARDIEALLLNARSFLQSVGMVIQGGQARQTAPLQPPEDLSGASILKVQPRGRFDRDAGLANALTLLEEAPPGPRAIVVVTDGDDAPADALEAASALRHAGVSGFVLAPNPDGWAKVCSITGGQAVANVEALFDALAELAGSQAAWRPPDPERVAPGIDEDYEFEVVIEALEGTA